MTVRLNTPVFTVKGARRFPVLAFPESPECYAGNFGVTEHHGKEVTGEVGLSLFVFNVYVKLCGLKFDIQCA